MFVAVIFAYISGVVAQSSSSVSITAAPGYVLQRQCVKCNLWECYGDVNDFLQCDRRNYCYCRTDLSSAVNSFLSSRLSTDCTPGPPTNDISAAISIYSQYCAQALGNTVTTSQTLPPSTSAKPAPLTSSPPPTRTAVVSNTRSLITSTTVQIETATASSNAQSSLSIPLTSKWISLPLVLLGQFGALLFKVRCGPPLLSLHYQLPRLTSSSSSHFCRVSLRSYRHAALNHHTRPCCAKPKWRIKRWHWAESEWR